MFYGELKLLAKHDPCDKDQQEDGDGGLQRCAEGPGAVHMLHRDQVEDGSYLIHFSINK